MTKIFLIAIIAVTSTRAWAEGLNCRSLFSSGYVMKKSSYLTMDKYEKQRFLKNTFKIGEDLNPRFIDHDNLFVSAPFKVFGTNPVAIDSKLMTAAQKTFKKYEEDSRENTTQLVATVLYEPADITSATAANPWAVLISKKMISFSGKTTYEPITVYSMERNGASEALVRIIAHFNGLII